MVAVYDIMVRYGSIPGNVSCFSTRSNMSGKKARPPTSFGAYPRKMQARNQNHAIMAISRQRNRTKSR